MALTEKEIQELIRIGRQKMHPGLEHYEGYQTDQELKRPQPPLAKAPMCETSIALPLDFKDLDIDNDFLHVINSRQSHRVYTQEKMTLLQLSYLLWCSQGVKEIRGKSYATLRTVPAGGARHPFEVYMTVQNVEGLPNGLYHYLPMTHQIEFLSGADGLEGMIGESLSGQRWGARASVVFYYSMRTECAWLMPDMLRKMSIWPRPQSVWAAVPSELLKVPLAMKHSDWMAKRNSSSMPCR